MTLARPQGRGRARREVPASALWTNFLGHSPGWYKRAVVVFVLVNPVLLVTAGPFVTGWAVLAEFVFCLAMALRCYPLQPGGLLALEAVALGLTSTEAVYRETTANFSVILLVMFMVAGIYFMRELLSFAFTRVLLRVRSKLALSLAFLLMGAVLSAFLDALTVTAVIIAVVEGFYLSFHRFSSGRTHDDDHDSATDIDVHEYHRDNLEAYRAFLRSLVMHGLVGTALGGVATLVGEPQNLLIGQTMGWDFLDFARRVAPVSAPVLLAGLAVTVIVEWRRWFGFGTPLPESVRALLAEDEARLDAGRSRRDRARLVVQGVAALLLVMALGLHLAEVGLIGLAIIVLQTAFNGVTEEHQIGAAFAEALPFVGLLVVFFTVVAVIHDQHLFTTVIEAVLRLEGRTQLGAFYLASGVLSTISDNVFVATVYISDVEQAFEAGTITRAQFEHLAVAINAGTNIPSVATPNGQAAFLFLLTSALAPLIRLSYVPMIWMALPYTVVLTLTGLLAVMFLL
ncbi:MAG: sodium/proton antiporter NhaB [Dehalococcoidia bacterium]|nr:sodium/proton antiporter NhaB [Dehalococcoidia bacterium]